MGYPYIYETESGCVGPQIIMDVLNKDLFLLLLFFFLCSFFFFPLLFLLTIPAKNNAFLNHG